MIRHLILPSLAAAALAASTASATPTRDVACQAAGHVLPARVDAAAQAATIRGIGDRRLAR